MSLNKHTKKDLIQEVKIYKELNQVKDQIILREKNFTIKTLRLCGKILKDWKKSSKIWEVLYWMAWIMGVLLGIAIGGAI